MKLQPAGWWKYAKGLGVEPSKLFVGPWKCSIQILWHGEWSCKATSYLDILLSSRDPP